MLTLGIDLSTKDSQTAACFLDWRDGPGKDRTAAPYIGLSDEVLLDIMPKAHRVAIDAPFGWPDAFRRTVNQWSEHGHWGGELPRRSLRYRLTDQFQIERGRTPLSVSSDRIASTAMRCAALLAQHHLTREEGLDRVNGHVVEAYPAGALVAWGFDVKGYKDATATDRRRELIDGLRDVAGLQLSPRTVECCAESDHTLDALVCALVARAQARGLTHLPPDDAADQVAREGWIHLPVENSLSRLAD